jgi:hypothetical protein
MARVWSSLFNVSLYVQTMSTVMDLANIIANIRVDADSQRGSVIDVIRLINPNLTSGNATNVLNNLTKDNSAVASGISQLRINGKGKLTPLADARTLVEIVWALPGKAARDFRRSSAQTVCRVLGGDLSLVEEIEVRHHTLQQSEEGKAAQDFLVQADGSQVVKRLKVTGPSELESATLSQRRMLVDALVAKRQDEVVQQRVATLKSAVDLIQMLGGVDDKDKIEFKDRIRLACRPVVAAVGSQVSPSTLTVATPILDPGASVPTPECDEMVRGVEISIPLVASELNVVVGDKAGQVGKRIKVLYEARYGAHAAHNLPKRQTLFRGKPVNENTYYMRDKDLLVQAVQDITGQK